MGTKKENNGNNPEIFTTKCFTVQGRDKIEKVCHILENQGFFIMKNFVKWFSTKHGLCVPEFLDIEDYTRTIYKKINNDLDCITFCSVDKLAIILEYKIMENDTAKDMRNNIIHTVAKYNIVFASEKPCFSSVGTFGFDILFGEKAVKESAKCTE
jgi:hypothetical protein